MDVCGRCEWNAAAWPQCGQVTLAPSYPFFLREALLDRLGGDLVSNIADLELVVTEDVGVVGGGEVGGQLADLSIDCFADGSGEILNLGPLLGREWIRRHGRLPFQRTGFHAAAHSRRLCTKIPPTLVTPTG